MNKRVVVTGLGVVSPLGCTAQSLWSNIVKGNHGIKLLSKDIIGEGSKTLPCKTAATIEEDSLKEAAEELGFNSWISNKRAQEPKYISYALHAAKQCLATSNFLSSGFDPDLVGVSIGSGIGASVSEVSSTSNDFNSQRGLRSVSPYFVPRLLINEAAAHVSIENGFCGPLLSNVAACASGAQAIIDAFKAIQFGEATAMIAGGTDSSIDSLSLAGFSRLKALSTSPDLNSSRPFDSSRSGFVMGEGCGLLLLEELQSAEKRGAEILCEIKGFATTADAFHITAPENEGRGQIRCMQKAMKMSEIGELDYINCHATSTPLGDKIEAASVSRVIGQSKSKRTSISSNKGHIGHLLGAAGAVESAITILGMKHNVAAHTHNLEEVDPEILSIAQMYSPEQLEFVMNAPRDQKIKTAMSNSFGFGGVNTSIVFSCM